jgi:hypothetical protein
MKDIARRLYFSAPGYVVARIMTLTGDELAELKKELEQISLEQLSHRDK